MSAIHVHGSQEHQRSALFDVKVCHPVAHQCKDRELQPINRMHKNEEKRLHLRNVLDIEHGTFSPFSSIHHNWRNGKQEVPQSIITANCHQERGAIWQVMSWIRISFTLLISAIICLRCSWAIKRFLREVKNADIDIENVEGAIRSNYSFFSTFFA